MRIPPAEICLYVDSARDEFRRLNEEWISEYFRLEPRDVADLADPVGRIIAPGGQVFFAFADGRVIGTCAVIKVSAETYEIAKMAVDRAFRGQGISTQLMQAAESWMRARGARRVVILSNSRLQAAVGLYRRFGYRVTFEGAHPEYLRCDIGFDKELSRDAELRK